MKSISVVAVLLAVTLGITPQLRAQAQPSFAGTWAADISRSAGPEMARPLSANCTITYGGDSIIVNRSSVGRAGPLESRIILRLDGHPTHSRISVYAGAPGGGTPEKVDMDASIVTKWARDTLVIMIESKLHGMRMEQVYRWALSPDRNTFTEQRTTVVDGNDAGTQGLLFRRRR